MAIRRTTATPKAIIELIVKGYVFTLVNILTKTHVTYKTIMKKAGVANVDVTIISAKTTGNKYIEIGSFYYSFDSSETEPIWLLAHKKGFHNDPMFTLLCKFYLTLIKNQAPSNIDIWHPCRCRKCKRLLTDPTSIDRGIGPGCAAKMNKERFGKTMT